MFYSVIKKLKIEKRKGPFFFLKKLKIQKIIGKIFQFFFCRIGLSTFKSINFDPHVKNFEIERD